MLWGNAFWDSIVEIINTGDDFGISRVGASTISRDTGGRVAHIDHDR